MSDSVLLFMFASGAALALFGTALALQAAGATWSAMATMAFRALAWGAAAGLAALCLSGAGAGAYCLWLIAS